MSHPEVSPEYAALTERMSGLESMVREIRDRQKFPWPAVGVGVGVLSIILAFAIWGFSAYTGATQNSIMLVQQQNNERMDRFEAALLRMQDGIVPRGEHQERWRSLEGSDANLQRQIEGIRTEFGSSFSLNDALKQMEERLSRLEQLRLVQTVPGGAAR